MTRQKGRRAAIFNGQPEKIRDRTDRKRIMSVIRFQEAAKAGNGSDPLLRDADRRPVKHQAITIDGTGIESVRHGMSEQA